MNARIWLSKDEEDSGDDRESNYVTDEIEDYFRGDLILLIVWSWVSSPISDVRYTHY